MTIDTKRIATDAAYWDSVAPEGATHYDPTSLGGYPSFIKWDGARWEYFSKCHREWIPLAAPGRDKYIPRPRPQSEWVDGFPPIGAKVECTFAVEHHDTWHKGKVAFYGIDPEGRDFFIVDTGTYQACYRSTDHVRPILTKAQRDRDELIKVINDCDEMAYSFRPDDIADAIMAAGWRKDQ